MIGFLGRVFRALFYGFLVFFVFRLLRMILRPLEKPPSRHKPSQPTREKAPMLIEDPVCGVFFPEDRAILVRNRKDGTVYRVCSQECAQKLMTTNQPESQVRHG